MAQVQSYGSVTWITSNHTKSDTKPRGLCLVKPSFTFGRLSSNDCRMAFDTCSKVHATITVDTDAPYDAVIGCSGVNGLHLNGRLINKGESADLNDGDLIVICERTFKWGTATLIDVKIDTPERPNIATSSPRLSLVWPCEDTTPSSPNRAVSLLSGLLSPFRSSAPSSPVVQQSLAPTAFDLVHTDLSTWDQMDEEAGDLVTWEEEEDEVERDEDEQASGAPLALSATPFLGQRARSLHSPMSADRRAVHSPTSRNGRRLSMRMTIVPTSQAEEWLQERQEKLELAQAQAEKEEEQWRPTSPTPSPRHVERPTTPTRRRSSTSRRISSLLLSPALEVGASLVPSDDEEAANSDSDSSSDSDDEHAEADEDIPLAFPLTPITSLATTTPLPASPADSPTSTPLIPRHSLTRRHSLREKVLIRSAIKSVITPPLTPRSSDSAREVANHASFESTPSRDGSEGLSPVKTPRDSLDLVRGRKAFGTPMGDTEEDEEGEHEVEDDAMDVDEVEAEVELPSQPIISPSTPVQMITIPRLIPTSAVARQAALVPLPETPSSLNHSYTPQTTRPVFMPELHHVQTGTPTFMSSPALIASESVSRSPEAAPTTPNKFSGFVYHSNTNTNTTPSRSTPVPSAPIFEYRPSFTPEMTSPITHHRHMSPPKSALRPMIMTGRRKSIKGFLAAPPSSVKRRVVFNESVYVKEIVDIREPGLQWRAGDAEEEARNAATTSATMASVDPTTIPLPPSPTAPSTPLPAPVSVRKAPLGGMTPSESMKAALAQLAPSGPVFGTPKTFSIGQPRRIGGLPSSTKASRLFASNGTPMRRAQRVGGGTPGLGGTVIKVGGAARGSGTPSAMPSREEGEDRTAESVKTTSSTTALKQRMENLRSPVKNPTSSGAGTPYQAGSPIRFGEPLTAPRSIKPTPSSSKSVVVPTTEDDDLEFATPTRPAPGHQQSLSVSAIGAPTPYHSTTLKRFFAPSAPSAITPKMNGLKMMFKTPAGAKAADVGKTPGYEGLKELLLTPATAPAAIESVPETEVVEKTVEIKDATPDVVEVFESAAEESVVEKAVVEVSDAGEAVTEPILNAQPEPLVEQVDGASILPPSVKAVAEITVHVDAGEATVTESAAVVESVEPEVAPIEQQAEQAAEAPAVAAPTKGTRTKRTPTPAAVEVVEKGPVDEPVSEGGVTEKHARASRAKKTTASTTTKKTTTCRQTVAAVAELEAERETAAAVVEKKTTRGRGKKVQEVEGEPEAKVEATAEVAVVEEPKVETVKPKRATASKKKVVADQVELVAEEIRESLSAPMDWILGSQLTRRSPRAEPKPVVTKPKPAARKGRTTKAAALIFHEDAPEHTPEPIVVDQPKVVRKARSRSALKQTEATPQEEQKLPEVDEVPVAVVKPTRGRKAAAVVDTENVAPVESKPKRRAAAAVKMVEEAVEEPTTTTMTTTRTRALRTRK